jgi:hypothetical protein
MMTIQQIREALENRKTRSAWDLAVTTYAAEIIDDLYLDDNTEFHGSPADRKMLLNGASDWWQYSWSGCSLIYNNDIAERVCCPSEYRRCLRADGSLKESPNGNEHWLDVQGRALYQAEALILRIVKEA